MTTPSDERALCIITTGGTIDKVYFDANSEFQVGQPQIETLLREANVGFGYRLLPLLRKDSLELTEADRDRIVAAVREAPESRVLITHGTDTMIETARRLLDIPAKTIVLTGSMQPARLRDSDAQFNIGFAVAATALAPPGVHVAMNGRLFDPRHSHKNRAQKRFENDPEGDR